MKVKADENMKESMNHKYKHQRSHAEHKLVGDGMRALGRRPKNEIEKMRYRVFYISGKHVRTRSTNLLGCIMFREMEIKQFFILYYRKISRSCSRIYNMDSVS